MKVRSALIFCLGCTAFPVTSFADSSGDKIFATGSLGNSTLSDSGSHDNTAIGGAVSLGYRWAVNPSMAIGIEGGYANVGKFDLASLPDQGAQRAGIDGWLLGANGRFEFASNWFVGARAGMFRGYVSRTIETTTAGMKNVRVDSSSSKYYAGLGVGRDFNDLSVGLNYMVYRASFNGLQFKPHQVSIEAEYRFR